MYVSNMNIRVDDQYLCIVLMGSHPFSLVPDGVVSQHSSRRTNREARSIAFPLCMTIVILLCYALCLWLCMLVFMACIYVNLHCGLLYTIVK